MEDLREQKQNQWITTVGKESLWVFSMSKDKLFNEVSTRSLYFVKTKSEQPVSSDANVILDDDRNLYDRYMETAIADLLVLIGKRIPQSRADYPTLFNWKEGDSEQVISNDSISLEICLVMSQNHDNNLLGSLINACKEYLVCKVLEQWYGINFNSAEQERRINHILQYRRETLARRVRPLL
jgi:hypothetical protein